MDTENQFEGHNIFISGYGYPSIHLNGATQALHVLVWEREHGPTPKGMHIHHRDENTKNYDLSNLILLTPKDHRRIHAGWIQENGVWTKRPCGRCKQILPLENFNTRRRSTKDGERTYLPVCRPCGGAISMALIQKNKILFPEKEGDRKRKNRGYSAKSIANKKKNFPEKWELMKKINREKQRERDRRKKEKQQQQT